MKNTIRSNRGLFTLLTAVLIVLLMGTTYKSVAAMSYLMPVNNADYNKDILPGTITHFEIPVKTTSEALCITSLTAASATSSVKIYNLALLDANGKEVDIKNQYVTISEYYKYSLSFDIETSDTLDIGYYPISFNAIDNYIVNDSVHLLDISLYNAVELEPSYLAVTDVSSSKKALRAGDSFELTLTIKNEGDIKILNAYAVFDFMSGIAPDYTVSKIKIGDLDGHASTKIKVPLKVNYDATEGLKTFSVTFTGKDKEGNATSPNTQDLYLTVENLSGSSSDGTGTRIKLTTDENYKKINPDSENHFTIKIKNAGDTVVKDVKVSVTSGMGTASGITKNYTSETLSLGDIKKNGEIFAEIPFLVSAGISSGLHEISLSVAYSTAKGQPCEPETMTIYLNVPDKSALAADQANIKVTTNDNYKTINPDTSDEITFTLENTGKSEAKDIKISVASGMDTSIGITKAFLSDDIIVKDLAAGKKTTVKVPFNVASNARSGLYEMSFILTYNADGINEPLSSTMTVYVYIPGNTAERETNYLVISNVSQSPAAPVAGENVTISFDLINDGKNEISNLRLMGLGLSSNGFEPVSMDPYVSYGSLAGGAVKHIEMTFKCGENIPAGVNSLNIGWEYITYDKTKATDSVTIYVLGVVEAQNKKAAIGKPKLIISSYKTVGNYEGDPDRINAGDTIDFTFTVKNTHPTKLAKNIKLTISSSEGIFSPAVGTNIFYIDEIAAQSEVVQSMKLKVRADAVTGDYPLTVMVEYEYDDMSEVDLEKGGVTEENIIKLHAIENYRPVIENIYVDTYMGCTVGNPVDLSFEFYNMGKSTLGNVYVTVEGDFELANNSAMSYIGAVMGYGQEYVNPQVVPLIAGEATGILTVHFEDSNGDEVTLSQEFTAFVEDSYAGDDFGYEDFYDPSWDMPIEEPVEETGFKAVLNKLNVWYVYVIAGIVIAGVVIIITAASRKKKKNAASKDTDDEDY